MIDKYDYIRFKQYDRCMFNKQSQVTTNGSREHLCKYMCNKNIDFSITYYNNKKLSKE